MSLELKHVAEYLPYKVKIIDKWNNQFTLTNVEIYDNHIDLNGINIEDCKLILRPLSELDFDKLIDIGISGKTAIQILNYILLGKTNFDKILKYSQMEKLRAEHYDVDRLIPQGDAIDINDVEEK